MKRRELKTAARVKGFTLMEVMIVVVLIAVIAAFAIPSYNNSVIKSRRAIGMGELLQVLSRQEQYFVNNKGYATALTAMGYPASPYYVDANGQAQSAATDSIYQIALKAGASTSAFTLQAIPQNAQASDAECATLEISNTGLKSETGTGSVGDCW